MFAGFPRGIYDLCRAHRFSYYPYLYQEDALAKIESLHGTTPAEIFQSGLENVQDIQAVSLSVLWQDGSVTAGWSNVDIASLALMILTLDQKQRDELRSATDL